MECETTKQLLMSILTKVAHIEHIRDFEILPNLEPSTTEGFLSVLYTGDVKSKTDDNKISVIIKIVPDYGGFYQNYHLIYINESNFYSKIFPKLDTFQSKTNHVNQFVEIPKYFCGSLKKGKEYVVLENLKKLGYELAEKSDFLSKEHLELIFKVLGKFHALSFSFKYQNPENYKEMLKDITIVFENFDKNHSVVKQIERNVSHAFKAFDTTGEKYMCEKLNRIEKIGKRFLELCNYEGKYKCLIHGDFWSNNVLFKYSEDGKPEDIRLLDFQMVKESTPIHDLSFMFYSSASKDDLDKLNEYLNIYYQSFSSLARELGSNPEEIFPFKKLEEEWLKYGLFGIFMGIDLQLPKLLTNEDILDIKNRYSGSKDEVDELWEEKFNKIRNSNEFKVRATNIILHAIKYKML